MRPIEMVLERLEDVRQSGDQYRAKCPAHDDTSPSLAIRETRDGCVLLHCFAGCSAREITEAIGLKIQDLFPGPRRAGERGRR